MDFTNIKTLRAALSETAKKEAIKLWRLRRRALARGCSGSLLKAINEEAWWCDSTTSTYPERILNVQEMSRFRFAFR